jgi:hypothetical protein
METATSGLFVQKLRDFREIRDLEKTLDIKSGGSTANNISSISLGSLLSQQTTHAHLAAQAAMSYWRSDNKGPIVLTMSYGLPAKRTANVLKALAPAR